MRRPSNHAKYYADMAEELRQMQKAGFKVWVLLSVNLRQRGEGESEEIATPASIRPTKSRCASGCHT